MNYWNGEKGFHPESERYVKAYVEFYARKNGEKIDWSDPKSIDSDLVISAKAHLVDHLYKYLDTLDSKSSALLAFCGLTLASISLIFFAFQDKSIQYQIPLVVIFLSVVASSMLVITVIDVHWASADDLANRTVDQACKSYYTTMRYRTERYLWARTIMRVSVGVLGLYMIMDIFLKVSSP